MTEDVVKLLPGCGAYFRSGGFTPRQWPREDAPDEDKGRIKPVNNPFWMKIWKITFALAGAVYLISGCVFVVAGVFPPLWNLAAGGYFFISIPVYRFVLNRKSFWPL